MRTVSIVCLAALSAVAMACGAAPSERVGETEDAVRGAAAKREVATVADVELPTLTTTQGDDGFTHVTVNLPSSWTANHPFGGLSPSSSYGSPPFPGWVCTMELLVNPPRCGAWGPPGPTLTPPVPGQVCTVLLLSDPPQCGQWSNPPPALVPPLPGMVCTMYLLSDPAQCGHWEFPQDRQVDLELLIEHLLNRPTITVVNDGFAIQLDDQVVNIVADTVAASKATAAKFDTIEN